MAIVVVAALIFALALPVAVSAAPRADGLVVSTDKGAVQGFTADGVDKFLGIPYAAPPVEELRWKPPVPHAPWSGMRDATSLGNRCPQLESSNGPRFDTEDCLYLNVYRPNDVNGNDALPVLFWIHGGGFSNGSGDQHDGALMARTNHIVVVSVNYRLGVFGFLALSGLSAEAPDQSSGNYGMLDWLAAMRWTNQNIAAFGGKPSNVTIAGQSSGAIAVCANLASPIARGLFSRAVIESGSCIAAPLSEAEGIGGDFAQAVGCADPATAPACLRAKSPQELLDAGFDIGPLVTTGGAALPKDPYEAIGAGTFNKVPILIGDNHDEGRTFSQDFAPLTKQEYDAFVADAFGPAASDVLALYSFDAYPSPYNAAYAIGAIFTDAGVIGNIGGCPNQDLAALFSTRTRTYFYQFDDRHAPPLNTDLPGFQWGAGHAMELPYMWPSFDNGVPLAAQFTAEQRQLSNEMVRYWGTFARLGAPNVPGLTHWSQYRIGRLLSLRPGGDSVAISAAEYAQEHNCDFWHSFFGTSSEARRHASVERRLSSAVTKGFDPFRR